LDLAGADGEVDGAVSPSPGESLQRILRFELKEEGNHVLAVTVTYTETALGEGKASGGRVRTFRKLYQFVAQQLLSVRTKAGDLSQKDGMSRYLLEAQLENMGEAAVSLEVRQPTTAQLCLQTFAARVATRFSGSTHALQLLSSCHCLQRWPLDPACYTLADRALFRRVQPESPFYPRSWQQ
jgi:hypothetical protein